MAKTISHRGVAETPLGVCLTLDVDGVLYAMARIRGEVVRRGRRGTLLLCLALASCGQTRSHERDDEGEENGGTAGEPFRGGGDSQGARGGSSGTGHDGGGTSGTRADPGAGGEFAGAAGDGPGAGLQLPRDCEASAQSETPSECSLSFTCGGNADTVHCSRLESGGWECGCKQHHPDRVLELGGAVGIRACEAAVGLCVDDDLQLGDDSCSEVPDFPNDDRCGLDLTCRTSIAAEPLPGVEAALVRSGRATCARLTATPADGGQAPFACRCSSAKGRSEFTVLVKDASRACRSVLDACLSEKPPVFGTVSTCAPITEGGANGCRTLQICGTQSRLSDDVTLVDVSGTRDLSCAAVAEGGSACRCDLLRSESESSSNFDGGYDFHLAAVPAASTCNPSWCSPEVEVQPAGPVGACDPTPQQVDANSCAYTFACAQPAAIDGQSVVVDAPLGVLCAKRAADESWWCSCGSGSTTTQFELGNASDSEDACQRAPAQCLKKISLHLGPTIAAQLPNPLP